ncbi:helix-turn-helix transcriptional regulator [Salimicrobium flavidum]|uniref:Transcriptional regulator, contains XRE-family HTH domain n=1 Tax=Salimicrobium flavidum TaxID=570947 RepID=A0A1N7J8S6_9BACI|nr:helix-turn-helix transcriptional regulator [Salimicrobium flavidum]SIS45753.1 Transcriptional regulator, contains XRE-family HTH domain [Salimicrobium flavidum]
MGQGKILKNLRKKKNLSQEEVARSIVSTSYLSRIENGKIEANEETLSLLYQRVGVDYSEQKDETSTIQSLLLEWESPLLENDKEKTRDIYHSLLDYITEMTPFPLQLEFHIKRIRHFLTNPDLDKARESVNFSEQFSDHLDTRLRFLFHKHIGNYHWSASNPDYAEYHFNQALREYSGINFHELEKADLHFLHSLVLYTLRKESLCFYNAEEALRIFQSHYRPKQCMKVHIQLGICHSRIGDFPTCLFHYEKAKALAEFLDLPSFLGIIEHNFANMYVRMQNYEQAVAHLTEAMNHKDNSTESFAYSLVLLLEVRYEQKDTSSCIELLDTFDYLLKDLSDRLTPIQEMKFFRHFLTTGKDEWERFLEKEFFPRLEASKESRKIMKYAKTTAAYYEKTGFYKKSAHYYRLALENSEEVLGYR